MSAHRRLHPEDNFNPSSLVDLLRRRATLQSQQVAYTFLADGEGEEISLTYAELDLQARAIGGWLQSLELSGERALLLYPQGLDYIAAFFGCLYAGVIAVPAYPPRLNRSMFRLQSIVKDARPALALATIKTAPKIEAMFAQDSQSLRCVATDDLPAECAARWRETEIPREALAFLQYTSGSTSTPKGVMVSHGNLLHNESMIKEAFEQTEQSVIVGWLPLYHDMGLIGTVLQPLYLGARCILMSPVAFLQRPLRWLEAISRYKATTSGGPNFAYELCTRKINPEDGGALDLSNWSVAFTGSEPVRAETLERFTQAFQNCGFRREAFYPCYGLAEATLLVSGSMRKKRPVVHSFSSVALAQDRVEKASQDSEGSRRLVGCGQAISDQRIAIVNRETLIERCEGEIGEVWVCGPSVAQGYWNRPEETERTFKARLSDTGEGPFLRTGDLGFVTGKELFITGRVKDLIIIRGLNHYPQDIELTAEQSHASLRRGGCAAFSVNVAGEERLVVVQELEHGKQADFDEIIGAIRKEVAERHDLQVHAVALVKPGSVPKTSSGKVQRRACRDQFLAGTLSVIAEWRASAAGQDKTACAIDAASLESLDDVRNWLCSLLASTLGLNPRELDINRPITAYGIDSLNAVELTHNIESTLGVQLPMSSFLQSVTLAQLALEVMSQLTTASSVNSPLASSREAVVKHPLSYGQKALWFLHQLTPESAAYNITSAVRILGDLDPLALRQAFQTLADRHPSIRTTFTTERNEPVQFIHDHVEVCFQHKDGSAWSDETLDRQLTGEVYLPFDLEHGPLMRVTLIERSESDHILLLSAHHIITDFWSLAVMIHEMGALYSAAKNGMRAELKPLALAYTDYVRWQSEMLAGPEGERLWTYWQKQLAGELPDLDLPTDRPRPAVQTYRGASHPLRLSAELSDGLKSLSLENEATLYMTLLAAFQALLHRYTGQQDILLGSPTSGRSRAELTGIVGYFVNPIVIKANFSGRLTFKDLLSQVRSTVIEAFRHQEYPFALLVKRLQLVRDASRSPLFQVFFALQKILLKEQGLTPFALGEAGAKMELGELHLESVAIEQRVAQFDLTLMVAEVEGTLAASFQFNSDLFDSSTIARLADHYKVMLESIVADPSKPVLALTLLTERERHQLLYEWNASQADFPKEVCVHQLFEAQAKLTPYKVAVSYEGRSLTYGELNERANKLARFIKAMGVGPEARVALCVERSTDMVIGLLGILKAGGAYVPLDYTYPAERIAFVLEDARSPVIITESNLLSVIPETKAQIVCLDTRGHQIEQEQGFDPPCEVAPANLAYVIYTSGSTGKPKGVQVEHRALVNFLNSMRKQPGMNSEDVLLAVTTLSFDIAGLEIFLPLITGASLELVRRSEAADAEALMERIARTRPTVMQATPATWRLLIDAGWRGDRAMKVLCGGEAVSLNLAAQLRQRTASLWNMYGPTETTIWSAITEINPAEGLVTIGRPIDNTQIYLLDKDLQPVPVGVAGELYIGGDGIARGYLHRPEFTAEKFVPCPFRDERGARLYATGDLARYLPDGKIEFLGRIDHQVKVRGFRIELGEVESAIRAHPSVVDAVVVTSDHQSGNRRLVAYVVPASEPVTVAELRRFIREKLPDFMTPSAIVMIGSLPLTPNGKVNRKALPPDAADIDLPESFVAPRTPIEELLVEIWSSVLGLKRVGVEDNFFEIGGHSLLATQLVSRVRDAFNIDLPLRNLFERPTVAGMAQSIETIRGANEKYQAPPITRASREGDLPLSFAQQRLWFLDQMERGNSFFNIPVSIRLLGRLNVEALEQSFNEILRRHEVLRTRFEKVDGKVVQRAEPELTVRLWLEDLSGLEQDERESKVEELSAEEASRPFDLARGPLLRVGLLRLCEQEHEVLVTVHHIASDAWSMNLLVREVAALYEAYSKELPSPLLDLPIQYADFSVWQRNWLQGGVLDSQLAYWRRQLSGCPATMELPADHPREAVRQYTSARQLLTLSRELSESLKELSKSKGVTLFMTLLAAFKSLLYRSTGQKDVIVGTDVANRNRVEVEGLIGFFVNQIVLRTDLSGDPSFSELLWRVREVTLGAYEHQDVPFEKLVEALKPERDKNRPPLFQIKFVMQKAFNRPVELAGLTVGTPKVRLRPAQFDLQLSVEEVDDQLAASLEYNAGLFEAGTMAELLNRFEILLTKVAANPDAKILDIPLLTEGQMIAQDMADHAEDDNTEAEFVF